MSFDPIADSFAIPRDLTFSDGADVAISAKPSELEREVIDLFEQFRSPLLRYSLSFGIDIHDSEEIIQEVFLALFQHLRSGKSRKNLRGWIFRVTHNLTLKRRLANHKVGTQLSFDDAIAPEPLDPSPNPEEQLSSAQKRRRLLAIVRALPETDQSCLRLRAEGLRYREIATVLGISLGSVAISLTRSMDRLVRAEGGQ
jgi:RNA polymerase sigma-70 factor, ECF subfamily